VIAVLFGVALLNETVSARAGAGAALILVGIALATFWSAPRRSS
jgi:drug/metabolite transporter (DMT)-like permease